MRFVVYRSSLDCLVADNFPLSSREFADGTPKYSDYIAALDKVHGCLCNMAAVGFSFG